GGHTDKVIVVAFSPSGRYLATGSLDGMPRVWDTQAADPAAHPLVLRGDEDSITTLAWSPDSRSLAAAGGEQDFTIWLWKLSAANSPRQLKGHLATVTSLLFSHDGRTLISAGRDGTARLWDLSAANPSAQPVVLRGHEDEIRSAVLSPDGGLL